MDSRFSFHLITYTSLVFSIVWCITIPRLLVKLEHHKIWSTNYIDLRWLLCNLFIDFFVYIISKCIIYFSTPFPRNLCDALLTRLLFCEMWFLQYLLLCFVSKVIDIDCYLLVKRYNTHAIWDGNWLIADWFSFVFTFFCKECV